jgi:hypothetical protein
VAALHTEAQAVRAEGYLPVLGSRRDLVGTRFGACPASAAGLEIDPVTHANLLRKGNPVLFPIKNLAEDKNTIIATQKYIPYPIFFSFYNYDNKSSWRGMSVFDSCCPAGALMEMKKDEDFSHIFSGLSFISPDDSAGNSFCGANR